MHWTVAERMCFIIFFFYSWPVRLRVSIPKELFVSIEIFLHICRDVAQLTLVVASVRIRVLKYIPEIFNDNTIGYVW